MTALRKESPLSGDVHVSTTGGKKKPKATISQATVLPVTGATLAAQQENPDDDPKAQGAGGPAKPFGKLLDQIRKSVDQDADEAVTGALVQVMHDCACAIGAQCRDVEGDAVNKDYRDGARIVVTTRGDEGQVLALLQCIKETAAIGHSFPVVVDPGDNEFEKKFGFDGDGAFSIVDIDADKMPHKKRDTAPAGGDDAWSIPFKVAKADADQGLVFGWASVVEKDGALVIDKQNDAILPEDLEKAAYDFVLNSRQHGEMHENVGTGQCIESMVFTKAKQQALGIDLGQVGWWVGFKLHDPATRAAVKRGDFPEFSIGGSGRRVPFP